MEVTRYEQDDFAGEDRTVVLDDLGTATVVPVSARRLRGEPLQVYAELMRLGLSVAELEARARDQLVPAAREAGLSWALIGSALGLTGEGARLRYSDDA